MQIIKPNSTAAIKQAVNILKNDGVIAIPTDTLYGLSANAYSAKAIDKIYEIKNRPPTKPMIILIQDISDIDGLAHYDERLKKLAAKFWPGPLTVVLNRNPNDHKLDAARPNSNEVSFRIPDCQIDLDIIRQAGFPIVSTTANISGELNPTCPAEIIEQLGSRIQFILDNGRIKNTAPSTIVDLTTPATKIIRPGVISTEQILEHITTIRPKSKLLTF